MWSKTSTTAREVIDHYKPDLHGKVAVVTGGNSGIGMETCKALALAGAKVILCSRNVENGNNTVENYIKVESTSGYAVPDAKVEVKQLDLADFESCRKFADELKSKESKIDFLVLNAGVMACREGTTKQGFETQIGTNHFGHHYLTSLLRDILQQSKARVVVVASSAHQAARLDIEDLHFRKRKYDPWTAYGNSKLANILFAKSLADQGLHAFSLHPGVIHTNLQQHIKTWRLPFIKHVFSFVEKLGLLKSIQQGASTTVYACVAPELDNVSGAYLKDCGIAQPSRVGQDQQKTRRKSLWEATERQIRQALSKS